MAVIGWCLMLMMATMVLMMRWCVATRLTIHLLDGGAIVNPSVIIVFIITHCPFHASAPAPIKIADELHQRSPSIDLSAHPRCIIVITVSLQHCPPLRAQSPQPTLHPLRSVPLRSGPLRFPLSSKVLDDSSTRCRASCCCVAHVSARFCSPIWSRSFDCVGCGLFVGL